MRWLGVLLLTTGCGPGIAPTTWVPLDVAAVVATLDNPTATVAGFEEAAADLEDRADTYASGGATVDEVVTPQLATEPVEDTGVEPDLNGEIPSTNLFLRIACPGPDATAGPDPEFAHGNVEVLSPLLLSATGASLLQGDLFFRVEECQVGERISSGAYRAVWALGEQRLYADGSVMIAAPALAMGVPQEVQFEASPAGLRLTLPVGDDYAVGVLPRGSRVLTLSLADGTGSCDLDAQPHPTCSVTATR